MKLQRLLAVLLIGAAVTGCSKPPAASSAPPAPEIDPLRGHLLHAQPKLPTIKIQVGTNELTAEIARRPVEIATGMMFRTNLLENEAMLFVFRGAAPRSFYMRNCSVALAGAYIGPDGEILQIIKMVPFNERSILSTSPDVQFVLELPQGWFERHQIGVGATVRTERGSLQDTFFNGNAPGPGVP